MSPANVRGSMAPRGRGKVLVVDDDPIILEVIRERLERVGYDVHIRTEALGTSQWVAREQPDVILLDVMMPALGGADLGHLLKRSNSTNQTPLILHSSMNQAELEPLIQRTSALGAIPKTADGDGFIKEFERLTAGIQLQR